LVDAYHQELQGRERLGLVRAEVFAEEVAELEHLRHCLMMLQYLCAQLLVVELLALPVVLAALAQRLDAGLNLLQLLLELILLQLKERALTVKVLRMSGRTGRVPPSRTCPSA